MNRTLEFDLTQDLFPLLYQGRNLASDGDGFSSIDNLILLCYFKVAT